MDRLNPGLSPDRQRLRPGAWLLTAWMAVWVPIVLWVYGPQNFLWLCNAAMFLIVYALWAGDRLVLSSQAGTVVLIGAVWTLDLVLGLATQGHTALVTAYMWNPEIALAARAVSVYHVFLPALVIWALARCGYDRRGPWLQSAIGAVAILGTWLFTEPERNINWVASPFLVDEWWLGGPVWVGVMLVLCPLLIYYPGHRLVMFILARLPNLPVNSATSRSR